MERQVGWRIEVSTPCLQVAKHAQDWQGVSKKLPESGWEPLVGTRSDIAFAVHKLTRKVQEPHQRDWNHTIRVLRYLLSTRDMALKDKEAVKDESMTLWGYSDAAWATDREDRKSAAAQHYC
jgi:hypothetical protein